MTINDNPRVKLTLQVQPEGEVPFQAEKKITVSRVSIPRAGDEYVVRYDPADPSKVEFDTAAAAQANASVETQVAEAAASRIPSDLATNGILGRGACVEVQKTPVGPLIDCAMTVGVRLVDGTPSYKTTTRISLSPENAAKLIPHQTLFTVRADPQNHQRVAISLGEPTPAVTIDDPTVVDPPARALRDGVPCRVTLLAHSEQFLRLPSGEDLYAAKVQVAEDGSEMQIFLPVPASAAGLVQDGRQYPAKRSARGAERAHRRLGRRPAGVSAPARCWPSRTGGAARRNSRPREEAADSDFLALEPESEPENPNPNLSPSLSSTWSPKLRSSSTWSRRRTSPRRRPCSCWRPRSPSAHASACASRNRCCRSRSP